jgi:predicted AAA+ superfamily ATPase
MINFTKLANDSQAPPSTVTEYVGLLEDTLIGFLLPAWIESTKRKAIKTGKFYFFDSGVTHTLAGTETLDRNSNLYGKSFEQFIGIKLRAYWRVFCCSFFQLPSLFAVRMRLIYLWIRNS